MPSFLSIHSCTANLLHFDNVRMFHSIKCPCFYFLVENKFQKKRSRTIFYLLKYFVPLFTCVLDCPSNKFRGKRSHVPLLSRLLFFDATCQARNQIFAIELCCFPNLDIFDSEVKSNGRTYRASGKKKLSKKLTIGWQWKSYEWVLLLLQQYYNVVSALCSHGFQPASTTYIYIYIYIYQSQPCPAYLLTEHSTA